MATAAAKPSTTSMAALGLSSFGAGALPLAGELTETGFEADGAAGFAAGFASGLPSGFAGAGLDTPGLTGGLTGLEGALTSGFEGAFEGAFAEAGLCFSSSAGLWESGVSLIKYRL
jgi:hypothetical protein